MNGSEFNINFWQLMVMSPIIRMSAISLNYLALTKNTDCGRPIKPFLIKIQNLGRQIGQINSGAFGVFSAKLSASIFVKVRPMSIFSIMQPVFLQKTKPLYPHPKYFFEIGI
jgi:hypothetical protein